MDIRPFTKHDTADVDEFFALSLANHEPCLGPKPTRERQGRTVGEARPGMRQENWLARENGTVVGHIAMTYPEQENQHLAIAFAQVHTDHRRRGIGRRLYEHIEAEARREGRTTLMTGAHTRMDGGDPDVNDSGARFAEALGFESAMTSLRSLLDLSEVEEGAHAALAEQARAHAGDYDVFTWVEGVGGGDCPEEILEDLAYLEYRLTTDMPTGDMDYDPERPDADRVRERAGRALATGQTLVHAAARHTASGKVVAWTFVQPSSDAEDFASQLITVVDPEHRGHRLGILVKLANMERTKELRPGLRYVSTTNAEDNAPMIAVNTAMGYRPTHLEVIYQKKI